MYIFLSSHYTSSRHLLGPWPRILQLVQVLYLLYPIDWPISPHLYIYIHTDLYIYRNTYPVFLHSRGGEKVAMFDGSNMLTYFYLKVLSITYKSKAYCNFYALYHLCKIFNGVPTTLKNIFPKSVLLLNLDLVGKKTVGNEWV